MYDYRWMNDPSESKILQDYIIQYQEKILEEISEKYRKHMEKAIKVSPEVTPKITLPYYTYVLSFSSVRDSNIFWGSNYSGLNGISIQMNDSYFKQENFKDLGFCKFEDVYYFKSIEGEPDPTDISHVASKVEEIIKGLSRDKEIKEEILPYAIWNTILNFLAIFHKHPSWAHEKEKRFVIITRGRTNFMGVNEKGYLTYFPIGIGQNGFNIYCEQTKIDFENNLFPRPYLQIELPKTTVNQITLGPNLTEIDIEAIRFYFFMNSYSSEILKSGAQIR